MKSLISTALRYENNKLFILNQQKLPAIIEWIECVSPNHMHDIILSLSVRGAPLIGIAAAVALADYAEKGANRDELIKAALLLKSARPTAVNLMHCIDKQIKALMATDDNLSVIQIAEALFAEDILLCEKIAAFGQAVLQQNDNILTHCNTGHLVTAGIGTALGVITKAHSEGRHIHVYVDETRPLLQGARLTSWELKNANVPHTLICDNMAASLMRAGKVQKIIVGADRIARNGDFANKIGTYSLAVLAHYHHIPFYVAAPYTTIDFHAASHQSIVIEERAATEVRGASGHFGQVIWSPSDTPVFNPAFDITPGELVTAFILDRGVIEPNELCSHDTSAVA